MLHTGKNFHSKLHYLALAILLFSVFSTDALAQSESLQASIEALTKRVEQNTSLSKEERETANKDLQEAQEILTQAKAQRALAKKFETKAANAGKDVEDLNQRIAELRAREITIDKSLSADELENKLMLAVSELNAQIAAIEQKQQALTLLDSRAEEVAESLKTARRNYESTLSDTNNQSLEDLGPFAASQLLKTKASVLKLQASIQAYEREINTIPARQSVAQAELDWLIAQNEMLGKKIGRLRTLLANDRSVTIKRLIDASELAAKQVEQAPAQSAIARENIALANLLSVLLTNTIESEQNTDNVRQQLLEVQQSSDTVERVLATGRVTDELGELLRRLRARLPNESVIEERKATIEEAAVRLQLDLILWQERLRNLDDKEIASERLLLNRLTGISKNRDVTVDALKKSDIEVVMRLVSARQLILTELIDLASYQADRIAEEKRAIGQLSSASSELRELLEQRLIWLPSNSGKAANLGLNLKESIQWLLSPNNWWQVVLSFYEGLKNIPIVSITFVIFALLILHYRNALKQTLWSLIHRVGNVDKDTYLTTPIAVCLTLILALPLPLFLFAAAKVIKDGAENLTFANSIAAGLFSVSSISIILLLFRSMSRKDGLFQKHFGWSDLARVKLRTMLTWFVWLQSITAFVFSASLASEITELRYGSAIIAFIIGSVGIALFSYQFFQPKSGVAPNIVGETPAGVATLLTFPVVVIVPLVIGLMPLFGFFDTAVNLQSKLFFSGTLLILSATLYGLMLRTFLVAFRRYLAKKVAIAEKAKEAEDENNHTEGNAEAGISAADQENPIDEDDVMRQSRSVMVWTTAFVFITGLWFIWNPLLPALGIVDDIVLWQETTVVDGLELTSGVTLWNIILSIAFVIGGFIAARNIRGVIEIGFFERFEMDAGARYAILTILGYVLVGAGLVIGLSQLGIDWSKLQWIIAALGVGLGFGLQEIVANFISGIIILFERPIRVGDFVTIGNLSGTVSNIKIRATTITDFDNREVLLPNKSIITENVTNWTLKDSVTRIIVKIGVAYGSDIDKVRELLQSVIDKQDQVLDYPEPLVLFLEHGDSSLNFEVRVFCEKPEERLPLTHKLNAGINEVLKANNIAIPFPQRDLHIVSGLPSADS